MRALLLCAALAGAALEARAERPFFTEDTGTQGKGKFELEVGAEGVRDTEAAETRRAANLEAKLAFGITGTIDIDILLPYTRVTADDGTGSQTVRGAGDVASAVKWRFLDEDDFSLALQPFVTFATGRDEDGLGAGRSNYGLRLIGSYESDRLAVHANAAYRRNRNTLGERDSLKQFSVLGTWEFTEDWKAGLEVGTRTNPDPASSTAVREAVIGLIYGSGKTLSFDVGYKHGMSDPADDRTFTFGVTYRW